jgi:hypothetical protein
MRVKNITQNKVTNNLKLTPIIKCEHIYKLNYLPYILNGMHISPDMRLLISKIQQIALFIITDTEAPITLRMPISFKRFSVLYHYHSDQSMIEI